MFFSIGADSLWQGVESIQSSKPDPCVFIVPKEYTLIQENISIKEIANAPLILLGPSEGNSLYSQIIDEFQRLNLTPSILCECHDSAILLNLVKMGFGATILPLSMIESQFLDNCQIVSIYDNPWIKRSSLVWRANRYLSAAGREFINFFRDLNEGHLDE